MHGLAKNHLKKILSTCSANRDCEYYPCHYNNQSCLWCYCPFYPCEDEVLGEFVKRKDGTLIWSCMKCNWIHKPDIAAEILREITELTLDKTTECSIDYLENRELLMQIKNKIEKKLGKSNAI
ncbi:cysteine-rich small domain [Methanococcus vannielii SB]|uniref:Cysteine-rich small domain n=1 Tax=Methanococcus vannielii (strain ATCC 35089 / DSM 1224 / JCM 13029 / OCM 148 / SB) TaxID=406327 RepID=A6URL9_METVS|nr:cysteine-rich small domain-containing protein [Methanococcus vannielii]ABR55141.1 cysteine-rich small domain [Methanococcus vannielii SB]